MNPKADHIAIVMHDFSTGGTERIAIRLANQWVRSGRRVTIFCGTETGALRALVAPEVVVARAGAETQRGPFSRLLLGKRLARQIGMASPDIIFSPGNFHIPVLFSLASFLGRPRPPFVCKISNPLNASSGLVKKAAFRRIDTFVAMSDILASDARRVIGRARIITVPEPILDPGVEPLPAARSSKLVACAGRLVEQKNFALAIEAIARCNRDADIQLVILGEGPERKKLEQAAVKHGIENRVRFLGHVPDIRAVLQQANLLLMTSRYEGYPAVLIEALSNGLPVVTTDCSKAIGEILIHPSFGRTAAGNAADLARALELVASGPAPDPTALAELVNRHDIAAVAPDYLRLFDDVVGRRRKSRNASYDLAYQSGASSSMV